MTNPLAGKYVVIEGPDGVGKTTTIRLLKDHLSKVFPDLPVHTITEPSNTDFGRIVRKMVMEDPLNHETSWFLFMADRCRQMREVRTKYADHLVISDRSYLSSIAYQWNGHANQALGSELSAHMRTTTSVDAAVDMHETIFQHMISLWDLDMKPDAVVVLFLPDDVRAYRMRSKKPDAMESTDAAFQNAVVRAYKRMAFNSNAMSVLANESPEDVMRHVCDLVCGRLGVEDTCA